jgi:threonine dehydrogenase-like Zn-dependent dehydrogenase
MKTTAVRLYGKSDLRLETFELPAIKEDEILVKVVSDSICMSTYKAAIQGSDHKRVPDDIAQNPIVVGHEFCGDIIEVGAKWQHRYKAGNRFTIQPALNYKGSMATPGYAYRFMGGAMTYCILANEVMEMNCLLDYHAPAYFFGSVAEPLSCIVGTYHAMYHTQMGKYDHLMGIKEGGSLAILAGAGPMGLGAIDYAIHCDRRPSLLVVTDIDQDRLDRAASIYTVEEAANNGVRLVYLNTRVDDPVALIKAQNGGNGYDDVMVFAPVAAVIEQGDKILGYDGCLNFFAGPTNTQLTAQFNFYNVHYNATHLVGTSGGNTDDMIESLEMIAQGKLNPSAMITHVGGLDSVIETTLNLPKIPGGKKLVYTGISMPLTAIDDFAELGKADALFAGLAERCPAGLWTPEAEAYLLENAKPIEA